MLKNKGGREKGKAPGEPIANADPAGAVENAPTHPGRFRPVVRTAGRAGWLEVRIRAQQQVLKAAFKRFSRESDQEFSRSYASEWLLDNFHVVEQAWRQIGQDMPKTFYRQLPKLKEAGFRGKPRVYAMALDILRVCNGELKADPILAYIHAYQEEEILEIGEIWALPVMLRLGALECLTAAVSRITGITAPEADTAGFECKDVDDEALVAGSVISLRMISTHDWNDFFEQTSRVEQILASDPSGAYAGMDFESRDAYRKEIEKLALASRQSETRIAGEAVRLARAQWGERRIADRRETHVGFFLIDAGRERLEAAVKFKAPLSARFRRLVYHRSTPVYLGAIALLGLLILSGLLGYAWRQGGSFLQLAAVFLLSLIPAITSATTLVNWAVTRILPPRVLPKLDFSKSIPEEWRTIIVIPAIFSDIEEIDSLLRQLEIHYLGNSDPQLAFALLSDFPDASRKEMPEDRELISYAIAGLQRLNERYRRSVDQGARPHAPFYLFHRERRWNPGEDKWMGWERKRGKLEEFNRWLLKEGDTAYAVQVGDLDRLEHVRFVITLDADTLIPRETAHRLVGTLAHPLNRPKFDPRTGEVVSGYTVLQPRTETKPASANHSMFTRIFTGNTGLDLYTLAVSDVYQDLFGEGIYTGKGIYDVSAFECGMHGRVPDNALLSHDLFEGLHVRVGLVTDTVLLEENPTEYLVYARRLHRWVRGDWQLLPWLMSGRPYSNEVTRQHRLSVISRWKIADNLIRSLFPPALLLLFLGLWLIFPGSGLVWTVFALLLSAVPLAISLVNQMPQQPWRKSTVKGGSHPMRTSAARWLLMLAFLPHEAIITVDAIFRTLFRITVSRKHLLEWATSASTMRLFEKKRRHLWYWQQMGGASLLALGAAFLVGSFHLGDLVVALPLLAAWFLSPRIAFRISRPIRTEPEILKAGQRYQIRRMARRTWFYFEQFAGPDDYWLPPDHFQESPRGMVAHRTSPTNLGLLLLSTLAAHDLGYIGLPLLSIRLRNTFETMEKLERYRGHFLNWIDTRNLAPLPPRYVSTVDSGNLAAFLLALREGCLEMADTPLMRWERWQGILDTLDVMDEIVENFEKPEAEAIKPLQDQWKHIRSKVLAVREEPEHWMPLLESLEKDDRRELDRRLAVLVEEKGDLLNADDLNSMRLWTERIRYQLRSVRRELIRLAPWISMLDRAPAYFKTAPSPVADAWQALKGSLPVMPRLKDVSAACDQGRVYLDRLRSTLVRGTPSEAQHQALEWCDRLADSLVFACRGASGLMTEFQAIASQAEAYVMEMDFKFLFNPQRRIFRIGYNVDAGLSDQNHYDLLASEARIASLVAISKGDIPQRHWIHLSRPLTLVDDMRSLLSWSGSMFEYLMPMLLMREEENSLLGQSNRAAVERQIRYGRQKNVPWGISESAYFRFDRDMNYQYRAFGVPGLGYKRGLEEDLVVAPYASMLALPLTPKRVMDNFARFVRLGALGNYGLYESIDFTISRLALGEDYAVIRSFYSHHQGMIFLSMVNYLLEDIMVNRFHRNPRVQSVELLLQEQVSPRAPIEQVPEEEAAAKTRAKPKTTYEPWPVPVHTPYPRVCVLSNGAYTIFVSSSGGGFSRFRETDLTRWRADTTLDDWGTWIYILDRERNDLWSAAFQPTAAAAKSAEVLFSPHQADFRSQFQEIATHLEITVSPDDPVEIRRLTLTNLGTAPRRLLAASYAEVVLAPMAADRRHPGFNRIFIESDYRHEMKGLLFRRRPRASSEEPVFLFHGLLISEGLSSEVFFESDRARFLGRLHSVRRPRALSEGDGGLSGTMGATLDPIMSVGTEMVINPDQPVQLIYITLSAESEKEAIALAGRYRDRSLVSRAFERAASQGRKEMRQLELTSAELHLIQHLLSVMLYPGPALRAHPATLSANILGQPSLWPHAVSGDYPILLARISNEEELLLVYELLRAHTYFRSRRIKIDMVILNTKETGYAQELHGQLRRLIVRSGGDAWQNQRGGIFLLRADQMEEADRVLLATAARAVFDGENGGLAAQLNRIQGPPSALPDFVASLSPAEAEEGTPEFTRPDDLLFDNGLGGFTPDGREYVIWLEPGRPTPAPWINVIANPDFGFTVSESGSGITWAQNSGENRLTPWQNDPVSDPPGEALYLRDEETARVWSPMPLPAGTPGPYLIRHGAGYTVFEHHSFNLKQRVRLFCPKDAPVKITGLRLENTGSRVRRITATCYAEWVLGPDRDSMQAYVIPEYEDESQALLARNPYNVEFADRVAFLTADKELHGLTASRTEFLGRMGHYRHPAALSRIGLASAVRPGDDPCAAVQVHIDLSPGEAKEVAFLLGQGANRRETLLLIQKYKAPGRIDTAWKEMNAWWEEILSAVTVRTPDPAMDLLLNRWMLYQNLSCRVWGRSALYQSSGAYGFRDQLQDVMALVHARPDVTRDHILEAARRQFEEGDVLHWWHPPTGRGVRTKMSDDLLWLPFVIAQYVKATGDASILEEKVPFLNGKTLEADEEERYGHYESTPEAYTVYEHGLRAIAKGSTRGPHGLPLIGAGDWNDGMNRVGIKGRGESVWLGWFLRAVLAEYAGICRIKDDPQQAQAFAEQGETLLAQLQSAAWDGNWYLRGYYDDGALLGASESDECRIDAIAQSWSIISGRADQERTRRAMESVDDLLVNRQDGLIRLFTPPFDKTSRDPGYIKGYPPGIRENGGQYTHAAIWTVWAFAEMGEGEKAMELFSLLNPIRHADTPEKTDQYKVEPYVIAADVYSMPPHVGRGGWTWYTGSGGWMYRLGLEAILGVRREGAHLKIDPCIPRGWAGFDLTYRYGRTAYRIRVDNSAGVNQGVTKVVLDEDEIPEGKIPLKDDGGVHTVTLVMG